MVFCTAALSARSLSKHLGKNKIWQNKLLCGLVPTQKNPVAPHEIFETWRAVNMWADLQFYLSNCMWDETSPASNNSLHFHSPLTASEVYQKEKIMLEKTPVTLYSLVREGALGWWANVNNDSSSEGLWKADQQQHGRSHTRFGLLRQWWSYPGLSSHNMTKAKSKCSWSPEHWIPSAMQNFPLAEEDMQCN